MDFESLHLHSNKFQKLQKPVNQRFAGFCLMLNIPNLSKSNNSKGTNSGPSPIMIVSPFLVPLIYLIVCHSITCAANEHLDLTKRDI